MLDLILQFKRSCPDDSYRTRPSYLEALSLYEAYRAVRGISHRCVLCGF